MEAGARTRSGWVTFVGVLFVIAGGFNLIWGLAALGVSLGGSDAQVIGDLSTGTLEGLGIAGAIIGGLQVYAGFGIVGRSPSARTIGIVLATLAILLNFAYHRVLDGWAFTGIVFNAFALLVLAAKHEDFE